MNMNAAYLSARRAGRHAHAKIATLHLASSAQLAVCIDQPAAREAALRTWGQQLDTLNAEIDAAVETAEHIRQRRDAARSFEFQIEYGVPMPTTGHVFTI
jgi:hypothetical protein